MPAKHIVILGAGTGQSQLLKGLKDRKNIKITAIVNVTDNGGSSKAVRESAGIPAPGDLRRCIEALAAPSAASHALGFRFKTGPLAGMSVGNLLIACHAERLGGLGRAVEYVARETGVKHSIFPSIEKSVDICAELATGQRIRGEWKIITRRNKARIKKVFLSEPAPAYPKALAALKNADLIVVAPGSFYTGLLPILLAEGLNQAFKSSRAKKIYVANIMSQPGQTEGMTIAEHITELEKYADCRLDAVIINSKKVPEEILRHYQRVGSEPLEIGKIPERVKVISIPLIKNSIPQSVKEELLKCKKFEKWKLWTHVLRHDPKMTADAIINHAFT